MDQRRLGLRDRVADDLGIRRIISRRGRGTRRRRHSSTCRVDERLADPARENEGGPPAARFLSCRMWAASRSPCPAARDRASDVGKPTRCEMRSDALAHPQRRKARARRRSGRRARMPSATASPWSRRSEYPVSASSAWPKVWPRLSKARRPLVSRSSSATIARLARDGWPRSPARARRDRRRAPSRHCPRTRRTSPRSLDQRIFDDLGIAGAQLPRRRACRAATGSISTSEGWWNAPTRFLPAATLIAGLAADRAVDLREQGGRHLDEAAAAVDDRRGETGEVADHAAAEGDDLVARARRRARAARSTRPPARPSSCCPRRAARGSARLDRPKPLAGARSAQTFSSLTTSSRPSRANGASMLAGAVEQAVFDHGSR